MYNKTVIQKVEKEIWFMKKKTNDLKKIVLSGEQVDALVFSLDVVIKKVGLRGLYTIVEIFQILQSPEEAGTQQEGEAKVFTYNVKEEQLNAIKEILDIAVKEIGIKEAKALVEIYELINNA